MLPLPSPSLLSHLRSPSQSVTEPKMGGRMHVVDGGLSDMYTHSVRLADGLVTMFWTLTSNNSIAVAVRGEHPTGYFAIGFGR